MYHRIPAGYVDIDDGRVRVVAARVEMQQMRVLLDGASESGDDSGVHEGVAGGRGGARRLELPGGKVVYRRAYRRGGMMRYITRDLFFLRPSRPVRELAATEQARAAGCPVPTVHAVRIEERGLFYRGWIVTSALEPTRPLIDALLDSGDDRRRELLTKVGTVVRGLHDAGVYHTDLTGHNLLVHDDGRVFAIDFDRAILAPPGRARLAQQGRDRLWRSLNKLFSAADVPLPQDDRRWLERGYFG